MEARRTALAFPLQSDHTAAQHGKQKPHRNGEHTQVCSPLKIQKFKHLPPPYSSSIARTVSISAIAVITTVCGFFFGS